MVVVVDLSCEVEGGSVLEMPSNLPCAFCSWPPKVAEQGQRRSLPMEDSLLR